MMKIARSSKILSKEFLTLGRATALKIHQQHLQNIVKGKRQCMLHEHVNIFTYGVRFWRPK